MAAVLARYPDDVVNEVTDPVTGLASQTNWMPTVREVAVACEAAVARAAATSKRQEVIAKTLARRKDEPDRRTRPTIDELRAKHGHNWGIR
jgi:hypothetical protein